MAAKFRCLAAARFARLLGQPWPLAADPRASARAGIHARALYLSWSDLDVGRRVSRLWECADALDIVRRCCGDPVRTLPLCPRAQGARCEGHWPRVRYRHAVAVVTSFRRNDDPVFTALILHRFYSVCERDTPRVRIT